MADGGPTDRGYIRCGGIQILKRRVLVFFGIRSASALWKNAAELSELILPVA